jgi:hypothetical protein
MYFHIEAYFLYSQLIRYARVCSPQWYDPFMSRQVTDKQVDVAGVSTFSFKVSTLHDVLLS